MDRDSNKKQSSSESKQKKIIIILAILLALSLAGLVARFLYLQYLAETPVTIEVPDNIISDDDKEQTDGSGVSGSAGFGVPANTSAAAADTDDKANSGKDKSSDTIKPSGDDDENKDDEDKDDEPGDNTGDDTPGDDPGDEPGQDPDPGNSGSSSGTSGVRLELFEGNEYTKEPFLVTNMFPGDGYKDSEARYYCIRIYHDRAVRLYFRTKVTVSQSPLADNLILKVKNIGTANAGGITPASADILDKTFSAADGNEYYIDIPYSGYDRTDVYFKINACLPTSTGNDCQAKSLKADFEWYVKDSGGGGGGTVTPDKPDNPDEPDKPDEPDNPDKPDKPDNPDKPDKPVKPDKSDKPNHDGPLIKPPKTGDVTNITLWAVMTVSALLLLIIVARSKRKEDAQDDR